MKKDVPAIPSDQQLIIYRFNTDEYVLVSWYHELIVSGDMLVTFTEDMRQLSTFLQFFRRNVILAYAADAKGLWFAFWAEPYMSGAATGVWIRQDRRHGPSALKLLMKCYDEAFKVWPVLVGLCKQEHLRDIHIKLGYTRLGTIPKLWSGNDVDVYVLTNERWKKFKQQ